MFLSRYEKEGCECRCAHSFLFCMMIGLRLSLYLDSLIKHLFKEGGKVRTEETESLGRVQMTAVLFACVALFSILP